MFLLLIITKKVTTLFRGSNLLTINLQTNYFPKNGYL